MLKREKKKNLIGIFLISTILSLIWLKISNTYLHIYYSNSDEQVKYIFSHPFDYIFVMIRTFFESGITYLTKISQVKLYPVVSIAFWVILVLSLFNEEDKDDFILMKDKVLCIFVQVVTILLIFTALYIQFTSLVAGVGNNTISGIQMRYFMPIILILGLYINKKKFNIKEEKILISLLIFNFFVFISIFTYYIA